MQAKKEKFNFYLHLTFAMTATIIIYKYNKPSFDFFMCFTIFLTKKKVNNAMSEIKSPSFPFLTWIKALRGNYVHKDIGNFDKNNWMSRLDGEKYINEISVPGSHDTCALYEPLKELAKCQMYTVTDQLNMGVRYLDIRANVVKGDLAISHGPIFQGITFDKVMEQCFDFLRKNPSETIIISVKHELISRDKKNEFNSIFMKKLEAHGDIWFTENRLPKLSEVRGKAVLLNRVKNLGIGIDASENWVHNGTSVIEHGDFRLHIQDKFKLENVEEAWKLVTEHFHKILKESNGKKNLSINFHSGVLGYPHVLRVAKHVNAEFMKNIKDKKAHLGIAVFDFITPEICNAVIDTNA